MLPKLPMILALVGATILQSAAFAQDGFISAGGETSFDRNFNKFHDSLDEIHDNMARSYDRRRLAAAQQHALNSDADRHYQRQEQIHHSRTMDTMVLGRNPTDQSWYNSGNNQANNGYMPGSLQGGSLLTGDGFGSGATGVDFGDLAGTFGLPPFPGSFGTRGRFSNIRRGRFNDQETFTRFGTNGFNGTVTQTTTGNNFRFNQDTNAFGRLRFDRQRRTAATAGAGTATF